MEGMGPVGRYHAKVRGRREAIVYRDVRLTWEQVDDLAEYYARGLAALGVRHGDRVAVLLANCPEFLAIVLACMRLGAVFTPLNIRLTAPELEYILQDAQSTVHITEHLFQEQADGVTRSLGTQWLFLDGDTSCLRSDVPYDEPPIAWSDTLFLCYTSGTTGKPKGAMLTHENVRSMAMEAMAGHGFTNDDRNLVIYPLAFTAGLVSSFIPVYTAGGTMVIDRTFEPSACLELLERERISVFFAVPVIYEQMSVLPQFGRSDLSRLRVASSGGAVVPQALIERYHQKGVHMLQGYGLTEGGGLNIVLPAHDAVRKVGSTGIPAPWTEVRVVDDAGADVTLGEIGELLLRGPAIMSGYWRNPDATAAVLRDGWLHTGDLVQRDAEGYIRVVERKDDMFISGGINVYPAELEQVIARVPGVVEVAVVGFPDERWGQVGHAFVALQPGASEDAEQILAVCREQLADYKVPKSINFIRQLPRGMSGKVLKKELRHAVHQPE